MLRSGELYGHLHVAALPYRPLGKGKVDLAATVQDLFECEQVLGLALYGAVAGSVLFRLLVAIALRWGLNPNDLKLVTALFVLAALVLPQLLQRYAKPASRTPSTQIAGAKTHAHRQQSLQDV